MDWEKRSWPFTFHLFHLCPYLNWCFPRESGQRTGLWSQSFLLGDLSPQVFQQEDGPQTFCSPNLHSGVELSKVSFTACPRLCMLHSQSLEIHGGTYELWNDCWLFHVLWEGLRKTKAHFFPFLSQPFFPPEKLKNFDPLHIRLLPLVLKSAAWWLVCLLAWKARSGSVLAC